MSRCYALTEDNKPCRNYAVILERKDDIIVYSHVCNRHNKIKEIPLLKNRLEWNSIAYHHTKRLLQDNIVEVNKNTIETLKKRCNRDSYTYFLLLCAKWVKGFSRDWNPLLFDMALRDLCRQYKCIGPIDVEFEDILLLLSCVKDESEAFFLLLQNYSKSDNEKWLELVKMFLNSDWGMKVKLHPELLSKSHWDKLKEYTFEKEKTLYLLVSTDILYDIIKKDKELTYRYFEERQQKYKNELLQVVWNDPKWVQDWCLDAEEKKEFAKRWNLY